MNGPQPIRAQLLSVVAAVAWSPSLLIWVLIVGFAGGWVVGNPVPLWIYLPPVVIAGVAVALLLGLARPRVRAAALTASIVLSVVMIGFTVLAGLDDAVDFFGFFGIVSLLVAPTVAGLASAVALLRPGPAD